MNKSTIAKTTLLFTATLSLVLSSMFYDDVLAQENTSRVPDWIKNNAKWFAEGQIGESDFVNGIKFLVDSNVMFLDPDRAEKVKKLETQNKELQAKIEKFQKPSDPFKYGSGSGAYDIPDYSGSSTLAGATFEDNNGESMVEYDSLVNPKLIEDGDKNEINKKLTEIANKIKNLEAQNKELQAQIITQKHTKSYAGDSPDDKMTKETAPIDDADKKVTSPGQTKMTPKTPDMKPIPIGVNTVIKTITDKAEFNDCWIRDFGKRIDTKVIYKALESCTVTIDKRDYDFKSGSEITVIATALHYDKKDLGYDRKDYTDSYSKSDSE